MPYNISRILSNPNLNEQIESYQFVGVATPTNPGSEQTPDYRCFYLATTPGTYTYLGGLVVNDGEVALLKWNNGWTKELTDVATANSVVQLSHESVQKTPGVNLIDFDAPDAKPGFCIYSDGNVSVGNINYWVSGKIPVKPSTTYSFTYGINSYPGGSGYINFYDSDDAIISTIRSSSFTTPENVAYLRLTVYQYREDTMLNEGAKRASFKSYSPIGKYTEQLEKEINAVKLLPGKNLFNAEDTTILSGQFLNSNGVPDYGNSNYSISGYIEISPNTSYYWSNSNNVYPGASGYTAFYDKSLTLVGSATNAKSFTTPSGAKYLRVTFHSDYASEAMLNLGSSRGEYTPFNPIGGYVDQSAILDGSVTAPKLSNNSGKKQWNSIVGLPRFCQFESILTDGGNITITGYPYYVKSGDNVAFFGKFSSFGTLLLGKGYNTNYGTWLKIDSTNVTIVRYVNGAETNVDVQPHGLIFNTFIKVLVSSLNDGTIVFIVQTLGGYFRYVCTQTVWNGMGALFVKPSGMSLSDCELSASNANYKKSVWCFGDSYLTWDSSRWPYYLYTWGFKNYMLDALSGASSSQIIADFEKSLVYGCPKFALWCLGMNDGSDTDENNPSNAWLTSVQSFIQICEENGVTPILATIPTVPTVNNEGKTKWVRNSGYRFVDFYDAVGANVNGTWYNGYLSNDGVHPTQLGGQSLATQLLIDFPEIME